MTKMFIRETLDISLTEKLPDKVQEIFSLFHLNDFDIWLVGAGVRNLLTGKPVINPDFTTNATPEEIQALLPESFYDNQFGTVAMTVENNEQKIMSNEPVKELYEITTYRTEQGYSDRRRPDKVAWGKTLEEDLSRRDFTINAMVIGLDRPNKKDLRLKIHDLRFVDPFGGRQDLEQKILRAVGNPVERFREDALRMMRAIRISAQLSLNLQPKTLMAIKDNAQLLNDISKERVRDELIKIIAADFPADGVILLYNSGLLEQIIPEMLRMRGLKQIGHHIYDVWTHAIESLRACPSSDPIIRLATLLHDIGKPATAKPRDGKEVTFYGHEVVGAKIVRQIAERLRFSKKEIERLWLLVRWHMFAYNPEMTDAAIRRFIRRIGVANVNDMMMLRVGDRVGGGSKSTSWRLRELQERVGQQLYEPMTVKDLKVDGHDVMQTLKIKPGPKIGEILNNLFEEVMEDTSRNEKEYLLKRIKALA